MTKEALIALVKTNLNISDSTRDLIISDVIQEVVNYCNLKELPGSLEPFIRKKVKTIINYEAENGAEAIFDVKSIKEGDTSITYDTVQVSRETIYGLSDKDKSVLRRFRRLRK